jgi:phenylpyruvate tautomerase PptA (4-oxalocrotonate tautomerase family)
MPSYTEVSVSSYNATPPADTGATTEANRIKWSTIKTKLGSPLNTAIGSLDDNIAAAITTITANLATATANLATATTNSGATTLNAPATTVGIFVQTAAPTGWTKGATHNDKALRLVSGAASSGGSTAFTSVLTSRTITSSNMPSHTHSWSASASTGAGTIVISGGVSDDRFIYDVDLDTRDNINNGGSAVTQGIDQSGETMTGSVSVSGTSGSNGSGTAMDFAVRYVDIIFATKD